MSRISIVIPTFNRANFLDQAIQSALDQTSNEFEIIISDNASTDHTSDVVKKYIKDSRIHYYRNDYNIGMVANWRKAIYDHTQYEWFIIMSDDDYFTDRNYICDAIKILEAYDLSLIYANGNIVNSRNKKTSTLKIPFNGLTNGIDVFTSRGTVTPQDFTLCNVIFKKSIAKKYNAFSDIENYSCDTELFLNSCLEGNIYFHDKIVSTYRIHGENLISQVQKNTRLAVGNLSAFLNPYKNSRGILNKYQMNAYIKNTETVSMIRQACLIALSSHDNDAIEKINRMKNDHTPLFQIATQNYSFKIELKIKKLTPSLYNAYFIFRSVLNMIKIKMKHMNLI